VLDSLKISDEGLDSLAGMKSLQTLNLANTPITDAGLAKLTGLSALKDIDLHFTKVTDQGVQALQQALPEAKISR
jgi:hypothetical protein